MRSRAMRLGTSAVVVLALAAVSAFLVQSERQIADRDARVTAFERQARQIVDALGRVRSAQQAYVAEGQGTAFWTSAVATLIDNATKEIDALYNAAEDPETVVRLDAAKADLERFIKIDGRAREYLR